MSPLTRLLIVLFIFEFSHLHADPTRNQILQARFSWSNMWDLANDIESLSDSGELDSQLKNKLLNILTWKRSSIFISQNIHIRKVKRAATDILLTQNAPSSSEVLLLSRSLDRATSTPRYEGNLDSSDYIYIAEVLVEWAYRGDPTASSELIRAIESNSATKVFEIEFALAQKNALDPNWLSNNPEFLSRIKRALGRPWVFELLKHYYEKELRFSQHAEKQFYLNHERPLSGQLKPEDLEIHLSIEDNSLFHFLLTLEALNQNPSLLVDRNRSSQLIAEAIEHVLKTHPNLRSNIFFATFALQSIEVFALHSPYIDHLVASWININFAPHSEIAQIPNGYEKALVKNIRNNAFNHLLRIQQRFQFSERLAKLSLLSAEAKRNMGFEFLPIEHPNSTALDRLALLSALNS